MAHFAGPLTHETEIRCGEASNVREDRGHVACADTEPFRERRAIFIDGHFGNPAAFVRQRHGIGTVDLQHREGAVSTLTDDCAADDEVMTAPSMVATLTDGF